MQNNLAAILCAPWTAHILCATGFVIFLDYSHRQLLIEKDLTSTLITHCKPQNEFSVWRRFVGETLNSVSKHNHCITRYFPQELFYLAALISDSCHPLSSLVYDITLLFLHSVAHCTLQTSVPVCCFIHTAVSVLSPTMRSGPRLSTHSLYRLDLDSDPTTLKCNCSVKELE